MAIRPYPVDIEILQQRIIIMSAQKFTTTLAQDDKTTACGIYLPFNPKEIWGKARTPVKVTINGHSFSTTTASMSGPSGPKCGSYLIPVNKTNRDAAGIKAGDQIEVLMELDTQPRVITPPADFLKALRQNKAAYQRWQKLSYSHQREHVAAIEEAKKPETRARRIAGAVEMLGE